LIADPGLRASMGAAARLRASEFGLDRMVDAVLALYNDAVREV
jgi:hypothetical protein